MRWLENNFTLEWQRESINISSASFENMILEYFHFLTKISMHFSELSVKNFLTSIRLSHDRVQMLGIIIHNFEFINSYEAQLHLVVNGGFEVHCLQHYYQTF